MGSAPIRCENGRGHESVPREGAPETPVGGETVKDPWEGLA